MFCIHLIHVYLLLKSGGKKGEKRSFLAKVSQQAPPMGVGCLIYLRPIVFGYYTTIFVVVILRSSIRVTVLKNTHIILLSCVTKLKIL